MTDEIKDIKDLVLTNLTNNHPDIQTNEAGKVALRCIKEGQYLITGCPSSKEYVAITEAGICLVWVAPQDAEWIMENKKLGCCGKRKKAYYLADETAVRRWANKGGR